MNDTDIDWSKAPKSAEYRYKKYWYQVIDGELLVYSDESHLWHESGYVESLTEKMTPRPESIPVYTPSTEDTKKLIEKLSFAFNNITTMSEYEDCYDTASDMLDAIKEYNTPPIELVDGKAYQFDSLRVTNEMGCYNAEFDRFYTAYGERKFIDCTNIQLLEVK